MAPGELVLAGGHADAGLVDPLQLVGLLAAVCVRLAVAALGAVPVLSPAAATAVGPRAPLSLQLAAVLPME